MENEREKMSAIVQAMRQQEDEIDSFIEKYREEMIESVCALVRIPSVASEEDSPYPYGAQCARALDYCQELAEKKGLWTKNYAYYGMEAGVSRRQEGKRLLFAAHTDVVPASEGNLYPPFEGKIVGDYIVGRGVVDDKAPLTAALYAMAYLKEKEIPLRTDVRLFCGSHEETDMEDFRYYLERAGQPDFGLAVDDDFPVTNGEKSILKFSLKGTPETVKDILEEVKSDETGKLLGIYTDAGEQGVSSCRMTGEEDGVIHFEARIPARVPVKEAVRSVEEYASSHHLSCEVEKADQGYWISAEEGIPLLLTGLYQRVTPSKDQPYVMSGCTYARHFRKGCGFGAGKQGEKKPFPEGHGGAHGPDEAHHIGVFFHAVKMYILSILAIDQYFTENE